MEPLKLIALDQEDIEIISTHLQDAVVKVSDIVWLPNEKRLVLGLNRFDWEACGHVTPCYQRRRTALRFERVMAVRCRNVKSSDKDAVLNLLAVEYAEADAPAGAVTLIFSGGAALRLEVECLECELADLGPSWIAKARPAHEIDAA
jgi:hypothetical protein